MPSLIRRRDSPSEGGLYFSSPKNHHKFISSGCTLLDCVLGGGWPLGRIANIVGDTCLAGDTIVSVSRGVRPKKMTIETLYKRANGNHPNRNTDAETKLLVDLGGYVGLHRMVSVRKTGRKVLYKISTENGESIDVSEDHQFKTDKGWRTIASGLREGSQVYCWRGRQTGRQDRPDRAVTYSIPHHPCGWQHIIAGRNYKRMATARLVIEAAMNNMALDDFIRVIRSNPDEAAKLAYSDPALDTHHLDGDPLNDSLKNLELITRPDHWAEHADDFRRDTNRTVLQKIKSVERLKVAATYDITMEAPHNNFVANGFVVHNSTGKTLLAIEACSNFLRQYYNGDVIYVESEAAFDPEYAKALGLPMDRVSLVQDVATIEELFDLATKFVEREDGRDNKPGLLIVDSLDALSDAAEIERKISEGSYGTGKARQMSQLFRRLVSKVERAQVCILIISQVRSNIGVTFGNKDTTSGGRALEFYSSQRLWLAHLKTLKRVIEKVERVVAITIKARCRKNKIGMAHRECTFDLRFGYGIDDIEANVAFLTEIGKEKRVPALREIKRMRGKELTEARGQLSKVVTEEWYRIEKAFLPPRGKYQE